MISQECREYRIYNKIISIFMDNASNNDASMVVLQNNMSLILNGVIFHTRRVGHILNLCVKEGYKYIEDTINIIRHFVLFIKTSPTRQQHFKVLCLQ
jgi:hypothetical protein